MASSHLPVSRQRRSACSGAIAAAVGALLLAPVPQAIAQRSDASPVGAEVRQIIRDELLGQVALDHVWQLSTYDRTTTTAGFHLAVEYVREAAAEVGLQDIRVIRYPADGKSRILDTYTASWAWRLGGGSLTYAESGEPVCRYLDVPMLSPPPTVANPLSLTVPASSPA